MVTNADLAERLALESAAAEGQLGRALRRASRLALSWPVEAAEMVEHDVPLTDLPGIGPSLNRRLLRWIAEPIPLEQDPLRTDFSSLASARRLLREHPTWRARCRGDLQMHSTWSDGGSTVEDLAEAASAMGHDYIAITDHSKGLPIAGGIDESALEAQAEEIRLVNDVLENRGSNTRVFQSMEMNVGVDGSGDMDPEALARLDLVLGSFHSKLRLRTDQTERYLAELANPDIQVLGHPKGRIYNFRAGLEADWRTVFEAAAATGKAVEVDCFPDRQDLPLSLLRLAAEVGVFISIGTDSHHAGQLAFIDLGLATALQAGVSPDRLLNFMSRQELQEWVFELRMRSRGSAALT